MEAKVGSNVKVHYTGSLPDGTVFDSSESKDPIEFKVGSGQVIPGFEQAIVGMTKGDQKKVTIPSEAAYGPKMDDLIAEIERKEFPEDIELHVGQRLQLGDQEGEMVIFSVIGLTDNLVTIDANHPLAGQDLTFDIELVDVS